MDEINRITGDIVKAAYRVHTLLGPGLLESVYETVLAGVLERDGMRVERQKPVAIEVDGLRFADAFRADLVVDGRVLVELKSVERLAPVHHRQVLTYLRLLDFPIGLLINFGEARLNSGLHRVVNPRASTRAPVLSSG